jgi:hypothetical protein
MNGTSLAVRTLASIVVLLGAAYATGCGRDRPAALGDTKPSALLPEATGACSLDGETRACRRLISEHAGVVTCSYGTQACSGGTWTACGGASQSIASFQKGNMTPALAPQFLPALKVVRLPSNASPATLSASSPTPGAAQGAP